MNRETEDRLKRVLSVCSNDDFSGKHDFRTLTAEQKLRVLSSLARFTANYKGAARKQEYPPADGVHRQCN